MSGRAMYVRTQSRGYQRAQNSADVIVNGGEASVRDRTYECSTDDVDESAYAACSMDCLFNCTVVHDDVGSFEGEGSSAESLGTINYEPLS